MTRRFTGTHKSLCRTVSSPLPRVKRYYEERGSKAVDALIEDDDTTVVITSLAMIETVSAVRREYNMDEIGEDVMYSLITTLFYEALAEFVVLPKEEIAFERSFDPRTGR